MSASENIKSNYCNKNSLLEERTRDVQYTDREYLTPEEMSVLTERLSQFNMSGGDPYSSKNCGYQQYKAQSDVEKDGDSYKLATSAYMRGGDQYYREVIIENTDDPNKKYRYPYFTLRLDGKNIYGITTHLNMVELQMLKCCIDAMVNAVLPLYQELPDREWNLFLPDPEEARKAVRQHFDEFFKRAKQADEEAAKEASKVASKGGPTCL